jgi:hypothetical protein
MHMNRVGRTALIITLLAVVVRGAVAPTSAFAGEAAAINAFELSELPPERMVERLAALGPRYRGDNPEELLLLVELLQGRLGEKLAPGASRDPLRYAREGIDRAVDLLYEWPSAATAAAIVKRLDSDEAAARRAGLTAALAAAADEAVQQRLLALLADRTPEADPAATVLALRALGHSRTASVPAAVEP